MPEHRGNQQENTDPNNERASKTRRGFLGEFAAGTVAMAGYFAGKKLLTKETAPQEEFVNHQTKIADYAAKYAHLEEFIISASDTTEVYQPNRELSEKLFNFNARFRGIYESYIYWSDAAGNLLDKNNNGYLGINNIIDLVLKTNKLSGELAGLRTSMEAIIRKEQEKYKKIPQARAQIKNYYDLITLEQKITDEIRLAGDIFLSKFNHIKI